MIISLFLMMFVLDESPANVPQPFDGLLLVRARVSSIGTVEENGAIRSTQRITHVYVGAPELIGKTFVDSSRTGDDSIGASASPPLQKREEGIWSLATYKGELMVKRFSELPFSYRARPIVTDRYDQIRALAESMESVAGLGSEKRIPLLREFALNRTAEISAWAIRTLPVADPQGFTQFFDELIENDTLGLGGQVALDEVLCQTREKEWPTSNVRRELLGRWVRAEMSEFEAGLVLQRLDQSGQKNELKDETLLELVRAAIANEDIPLKLRRHGLSIIGRIATHDGVGENVFAYLMEQIEEAKSPELRIGAANALKNFVPLDNNRIKAVRNLWERSEDPEVKKVLGGAMKPNKS